MGVMLRPPLWPARPEPAATPVSRTDTPSAASTVYAVRYQATSDATSRTPDPSPPDHGGADLGRQNGRAQGAWAGEDARPAPPATAAAAAATAATQNGAAVPRRSTDPEANASSEATRSSQGCAFSRSMSPPSQWEPDEPLVEVCRHATRDIVEPTAGRGGRWDMRSRLELFAANQAEKIREKLRPTTDTDSLLVTFIPAPPRRGAALQQVLEEEAAAAAAAMAAAESRGLHEDSSSGSSWRQEPSDEMARPARADSSASGASGPQRGLPPAAANPPLWPGVRRRDAALEVDDGSSYDGYSAETASTESEGREVEDEPGRPE